MNYEAAAARLAPVAAFWASGLLRDDAPIDHMGATALETSARLRSLALFALLGRADVEAFLANLSRSANVWRRFQRLAHATGRAGILHHVSGRLDPLFDGIAAGDLAAVRDTAGLVPHDRQGRAEYEDDYCTARLLFELTCERPDLARCDHLLARYADYTPPEESARLRVIHGLRARDQAAFADAFAGLLREFDRDATATRERGSEQTPEEVAGQSITIEGLAWLRLAEHMGIGTDPGYRFCPAIARRAATRPFPTEFR